MPITLTAISDGALCQGYSWSIANQDVLAEQIARVALGQAMHVERILASARGRKPPLASKNMAKAAVRLLTVLGTDPSHRDGWMFQVMSWIAAHRASPGGLIRSPQMRVADKGFDGLQLELDVSEKKVSAVVIFEDKATTSPRPTIQARVWPEFRDLDAGKHDNVVVAEMVTLLATRPSIDSDDAIQTVLWKKNRRFRISVTVKPFKSVSKGRKALFKGYKNVIAGNKVRRRGETFEIANLRPWMDGLAKKAITAVHTIV